MSRQELCLSASSQIPALALGEARRSPLRYGMQHHRVRGRVADILAGRGRYCRNNTPTGRVLVHAKKVTLQARESALRPYTVSQDEMAELEASET